MKISRQYLLMALLFLSLILVAAGIGAMVAGETTFGASFLISSGVLLAVDAVLMILSRRVGNATGESSQVRRQEPLQDTGKGKKGNTDESS